MRIAIIGYGKMGHMVEQIARKRGHEVVCIVDVDSPEDIYSSPQFRNADVAIEFTTPATAEANIRKAWAAGVPVVSGTTGWNGYDLMDEKGTPGLEWSPNFSEGMGMVIGFIQEAANNIRENGLHYRASITETHHARKLDKPSGTALELAETFSRLTNTPMEDIPIESIREGDVPGTHTMTLDSDEDTIIVTHIAKGREGFALGAVIAAENFVG